MTNFNLFFCFFFCIIIIIISYQNSIKRIFFLHSFFIIILFYLCLFAFVQFSLCCDLSLYTHYLFIYRFKFTLYNIPSILKYILIYFKPVHVLKIFINTPILRRKSFLMQQKKLRLHSWDALFSPVTCFRNTVSL